MRHTHPYHSHFFLLVSLILVESGCKTKNEGSASGVKELFAGDGTGYFYAGSPESDWTVFFSGFPSQLEAFGGELKSLGYSSHVQQGLDRAGYLQLARDAAINAPAGASLFLFFLVTVEMTEPPTRGTIT